MPAAVATSSFAFRRLPFGLVLAALPVLVAPVLAGVCADRLGDRVAAALTVALAPLAVAAPTDDSLTETELASDAFHPAPEVEPRLRFAATPSKDHGKRAAHAATGRAIRVSAAQVLALAQRRAMPSAAPVRATAAHPAGLELHGVSALGIGMQDGDVLTEAAGQRAASVATVVGVVLAARSRHSAEISGRFYRGGVPFTLVVEQPYPPGS